MKTDSKTYTLVSALALAAALGTPEMANAQAACAQWDLSQGWYAMQGEYSVQFRLRQQRGQLEGRASYSQRSHETRWILFIPTTPFAAVIEGAVSGTVEGSQFEVETAWGGLYVGTIDATGRIDGTTYDKRNSRYSARWFSDRRMNCLVRVAPPAAEPAAAAVPAPLPPLDNGNTGALSSRRGSLSAASIFGDLPRRAPVPAPATAPLPVVAPAPPPAPAPAASPIPANGFGTTCKTGYVRRGARATDLVCVTPASHARVVVENRSRAARVQPGGGYYGPNTCRAGFVWREAFVGDLVCVVPAVRSFVAQENQLASSRATVTRKS